MFANNDIYKRSIFDVLITFYLALICYNFSINYGLQGDKLYLDITPSLQDINYWLLSVEHG